MDTGQGFKQICSSPGFGHFYLSSKSVTGQLTGDLYKTVMSELLDNILPKKGHWNNTQKKINNTCYYYMEESQKNYARFLNKKKAFHTKVHLCEMFRKGKYEDTESEFVVPWGWE